MRTTKKILTVLLALTMALALIVPAFAVGGTCGENVTWVYDEATKTMTISGEGPMYDFGYGGEVDFPDWYDFKLDVEVVIIESGVTSVGADAFSYFRSLKSVTIPDGVTSIGSRAFIICESLQSVTIPDGVTSIGNSAFCGCYSLESVTIPGSVKSIGNVAFEECKTLQSVDIPDGVTSIGYSAFSHCESLESITIPKSVTEIGWSAFSACSSLKTVEYSGTKQDWANIDIGENAFETNTEGSTYVPLDVTINCQDGPVTVEPSTPSTDDTAAEARPCPYCGEVHPNTIVGKLTLIIHYILDLYETVKAVFD